ncbi:MAG: ParB/RepB/Spo0J family partition protein [Deltaproteobacteria bacterium]|nr:ParB/RepB/Spo0J family partition protein [Deltaproteobacteria bacterium]
MPIEELSCPFTFSWNRPLNALVSSIKELGLIHPLLVWQKPGEYIVISGTRRLQALKELSIAMVPVLLEEDFTRHISTCGTNPLETILKLAIEENRERGFNAAEKALIANLISELPDGSSGKKDLMGRMDLLAPNIYKACLKACELGPLFLDSLACGSLDLENIHAMESFTQSAKEAVRGLFHHLSMSYQKRRLWLELLNDLYLQGGTHIEKLLSSQPFVALGRHEEAVGRDYLYSLRYPKLTQYLKERHKLIIEMGLNAKTKLHLNDNLEDTRPSLTINFTSPKELILELQRVLEIAQKPCFNQLWDLPWKDKN